MSDTAFEHHLNYKDGTPVEFHWTIYDSQIDDEQLAELVAPAVIVQIRRGDPNSTVGFNSTRTHSYEILDKIRQFERQTIAPIRATLDQMAAAESAARFQTYLATLCVLGCQGYNVSTQRFI